jgi:hypothetical protein
VRPWVATYHWTRAHRGALAVEHQFCLYLGPEVVEGGRWRLARVAWDPGGYARGSFPWTPWLSSRVVPACELWRYDPRSRPASTEEVRRG